MSTETIIHKTILELDKAWNMYPEKFELNENAYVKTVTYKNKQHSIVVQLADKANGAISAASAEGGNAKIYPLRKDHYLTHLFKAFWYRVHFQVTASVAQAELQKLEDGLFRTFPDLADETLLKK